MTLQSYAPVSSQQSETTSTRLRIQQVTLEAEDIISIRLVDPDGSALPAWRPGAHVDVVLPSGLIRQYSLCGDPSDPHSYTIAVLREAYGRGGSSELHANALVGGQLEIRPPRNHFELEPAERYLFIAGGIGITPILPMVRDVAKRTSAWSLVYGGRSRQSMAFSRQLAELPTECVHLLPEDETGRPDLDAILSRVERGTQVYCCGPSGLIEAVEARCSQHSLENALHVERFTAASTVPVDGRGIGFELELRRSGCVVKVVPGETILEAIREVGPEVMTSCEEGFCGTCETKVLEGVPEHHDTILTAAERERGKTMMICVGRAVSERLVLDL